MRASLRAAVVVNPFVQRDVQAIEQLLGIVVWGVKKMMLSEKIVDGRGVVAVGRRPIGRGDCGFQRIVDDRKGVDGSRRRRFTPHVRRAVEQHIVPDREFIGGFEKIDERNRVAEDIAGPDEIVVGRDVEFQGLHSHVVAFARAQHQSMTAECHRLGISVGCLMDYA